MFDGEAFGLQMVEIVRSYLETEVAPLKAENAALANRVAELEARPAPERGEKGKDGESGRDGQDADPEVIRQMVEDAVKAFPAPRDGEDGKDGIDGKDGERGQDGRDGENGKDGAGIADLFIDRDGCLVASFTDGRTKNLGVVVGKDGGAGKDGRDGFSLDQFDTKWDGDRTLTLIFSDGQSEYSHELRLPIMLDRGVFADGKDYETGDAVTWGGSLWIAQRDTRAKPDGPDSGWRLAVKRGRDGKDKG